MRLRIQNMYDTYLQNKINVWPPKHHAPKKTLRKRKKNTLYLIFQATILHPLRVRFQLPTMNLKFERCLKNQTNKVSPTWTSRARTWPEDPYSRFL